MLDHDTDSYYKISRAFVDRQPVGGLTRDHILDNITTYWLTGTGASAARSYWESGQATARAAGQAPPPVSVPVGFTTFPGEIVATPRSWVEKAYPTLTYFNRGRQGRPLRRLGGARTVRNRDPRRVPNAALAEILTTLFGRLRNCEAIRGPPWRPGMNKTSSGTTARPQTARATWHW
jgi:hypothetical protein